MPWFVNEDLGTYEYPSASEQAAEFPNDFRFEFETFDAAEEWAEAYDNGERVDPDGNCLECGEGEGEHDRCCSVGFEEWCARVDNAYGSWREE